MKLTHKQSLAITHYLLSNQLIREMHLFDLGDLFDGESNESRIISKYGMAGKLWNVIDAIYITGWSRNEIGEKDFNKQQIDIDQYNKDIQKIIEIYK